MVGTYAPKRRIQAILGVVARAVGGHLGAHAFVCLVLWSDIGSRFVGQSGGHTMGDLGGHALIHVGRVVARCLDFGRMGLAALARTVAVVGRYPGCKFASGATSNGGGLAGFGGWLVDGSALALAVALFGHSFVGAGLGLASAAPHDGAF